MTNDEKWAGYLAFGDLEDLAPEDRAELDDITALLADPSLWDEPPAGLGDRVVTAIGRESGRHLGMVTRIDEPSMRPGNTSSIETSAAVIPISAGRRSGSSAGRANRGWIRPFLSGVAAAAAIAGGALSLKAATKGDDGATVLALAGTELAPVGVSGTARIIETSSGLRIELDARGLPRRDGTQYYQAWLKGVAGLVPIGTFHTGDKVVLWAGVSLADFPTLTVTLEEVGDQESSGQKVLVGKVGG